jgi:hypothetical protein
MSLPLPFPWSAVGQGLSPVLRDPDLLGAAVEPAGAGFRHDIITIARPKRKALVPAKLYDLVARELHGRELGQCVISVLEDSQKREKLLRCIRKALKNEKPTAILAQLVFAACDAKHGGVYPPLDIVCNEHNRKRFLDRAKFEAWLSGVGLGEERLRAIGLFACAFAILQPQDAQWILEILLARDLAFIPLLMKERTLSLTATEEATRETIQNTPTASKSSESDGRMPKQDRVFPCDKRSALPKEIRLSGPSESSEILRLLQGGKDWTQDLPLDRYRHAVKLLRQKLAAAERTQKAATNLFQEIHPDLPNPSAASAEISTVDALTRLIALDSAIRPILTERLHLGALVVDRLQQRGSRNEDRLARFDDSLERLAAQLDDIARLPWWQCDGSGKRWLSLPANVNLHNAEAILDGIRAAASRILQADSRLRDLPARLGEAFVPLISASQMGLGEIADHLEKIAAEQQARFDELAAREQSATDLLDRLAAVVGRQAGERFIREISADRWDHLGRFITSPRPLTDAGNRYEKLIKRFDLIGWILPYLWQLDSGKAIALAASALASHQNPLPPADCRELLSFLTFGQLQELAAAVHQAAPCIAELIFATALQSTEPTALAYLEPLVDLSTLNPTCAGLYRAVLDAWRAGESIRSERLLEQAHTGRESTPIRPEAVRLSLLEFIQRKPTMRRNYHRLRLLARTHFIEPLSETIKSDDPAKALRQWDEAGNLDAMVERCVRLLQLSGPRQKLDQSHYQQTRTYLEEFDSALRQWQALHRQPLQQRGDSIVPAVAALRRDATSGKHPDSAELLETIRKLRDCPDHADLPVQFGQRLSFGESGQLLVVTSQHGLNASMTWSWPLEMKNGAAPFALVLADELRKALSLLPCTIPQCVEEYWQQGDYLAARCAAEEDPTLQQEVSARLEKRKVDILAAREELLKEADKLKEHDQDVVFWAQEIHHALDKLEFDAAPELFQELEAAVNVARARRDPVRLGLLEFIREAGDIPDENAPLQTLYRHVENIRTINQDRRLHLIELDGVRDNSRLPDGLRERWSSLARSLDRPARWPSEETAIDVAWAIKQFILFLVGHLQDRESDPEITDLLVENFAEWLPKQSEIDPTFISESGTRALHQIKKIAQDIHDHRPEKSILRTLGYTFPATAISTTVAPPVWTKTGGLSLPSTPPAVGRTRSPQIDASDILRKVREFLAERMRHEKQAGGEPAQLRSAARNHQWRTARELAASLSLSTSDLNSSPPTDVEVVYAIALAHSTETTDRSELLAIQQVACLAALAADRSHYSYYLPITFKEHELAARGIVLLCDSSQSDPAPDSTLGDEFARALRKLIDSPPTDSKLEWVRDFLWKASQLGAIDRLADLLWETLRGQDNDESRTHLLRLLFQMRHRGTLKHLARHAEQIVDLIKLCLNAFDQAEQDSALRPQALETLVTLNAQSVRVKHRLPWMRLFQHLAASRGENSEPPVQCILQSDSLGRESPHSSAVVQLLLTPSLTDPLRSLNLQFVVDPMRANAGLSPTVALVGAEELWESKSIEVLVPEAALVVAGDLIDVGYQLTGETLLKKAIDLRGHWQFPNTFHAPDALDIDTIANAWPGASGAPVAKLAFHGRNDEIAKIDRHLRAPDRMRSLMIVGERRIGKTSLLKALVEAYPPVRGGICAAFFDCYGLSTPSGAMALKFFEFIVSKLDNEPLNEPLRLALRQHCGQAVEVGELARGLRPAVALEDALDRLATRLQEASGGLIRRMVFFFDEFDRFVEPYLANADSREETLRLHGSLRQIIQRSERLALIMAGSGLQRLFTNEYRHPFYGSVDELELGPFHWTKPEGRKAAELTFVPEFIRTRLCPGERFARVAERACELAGGNPYFLAMLGCAVGGAWRGQPLTEEGLYRVAELMIQNKIEVGAADINRKKFYMFLFEALDGLPVNERAVAKLMLVNIARLTSTYRKPWMKWRIVEDQFIEDPEVRRLTTEDQRLRAINHLQKEGVVEFDKNRADVRIRIPLRAMAIREDSAEICHDALSVLRSEGELGQ